MGEGTCEAIITGQHELRTGQDLGRSCKEITVSLRSAWSTQPGPGHQTYIVRPYLNLHHGGKLINTQVTHSILQKSSLGSESKQAGLPLWHTSKQEGPLRDTLKPAELPRTLCHPVQPEIWWAPGFQLPWAVLRAGMSFGSCSCHRVVSAPVKKPFRQP